jgi:hypothetical protein
LSDGTGSCPSLYSETATLGSEVCTVSTLPSDNEQCGFEVHTDGSTNFWQRAVKITH